MSRFEKSTPVSTTAILIPLPVTLYFVCASVEPVISPILDASVTLEISE